MVKTPGTCRRISVLCTKHSSTNKLDNSDTTATTTMNKAKRMSAKSMSHSGAAARGLPAPAVDNEHLETTMAARRAPLLQRIQRFIPIRSARTNRVRCHFPRRALSRVLRTRAAAATHTRGSARVRGQEKVRSRGAKWRCACGARPSAAEAIHSPSSRILVWTEEDPGGEAATEVNDPTQSRRNNLSFSHNTHFRPYFLHTGAFLGNPRAFGLICVARKYASIPPAYYKLFTREILAPPPPPALIRLDSNQCGCGGKGTRRNPGTSSWIIGDASGRMAAGAQAHRRGGGKTIPVPKWIIYRPVATVDSLFVIGILCLGCKNIQREDWW